MKKTADPAPDKAVRPLPFRGLFVGSGIAWGLWMVLFPQGYSDGRYPAELHEAVYGLGLGLSLTAMLVAAGLSFRRVLAVDGSSRRRRGRVPGALGFLALTLAGGYVSFIAWLAYSIQARIGP